MRASRTPLRAGLAPCVAAPEAGSRLTRSWTPERPARIRSTSPTVSKVGTPRSSRNVRQRTGRLSQRLTSGAAGRTGAGYMWRMRRVPPLPCRPMFISERHRRRRFPRALLAAAVVLVGFAVGAYLFLSNRNQDVHRGDKDEFNAAQPAKPKDDGTTPWPFYHYDLAHTAYLRANIGPPFRKRWVYVGRVLMEFPTTV